MTTKMKNQIKIKRIQIGVYSFTLEGRQFQIERSACEGTQWELFAVIDGEITDYSHPIFEPVNFKREWVREVNNYPTALIEEWDIEAKRFADWKAWGAAMTKRMAS